MAPSSLVFNLRFSSHLRHIVRASASFTRLTFLVMSCLRLFTTTNIMTHAPYTYHFRFPFKRKIDSKNPHVQRKKLGESKLSEGDYTLKLIESSRGSPTFKQLFI
ncbi:hypothetical protein RYX36_009022 [Vicia faba]